MPISDAGNLPTEQGSRLFLRIQGKSSDKDSYTCCCRGSSYQSGCEEGMQGYAQQIGQDRHAEEGCDNSPVKAEPFPVISIRNSKP